MASLPCNPRLGKLLVLGCVLGVGDLALSVAACLSIRSPLLNHTQIDKGRVPALEVKGCEEEANERCKIITHVLDYWY